MSSSERLQELDAVRRLRAKDPSLFSDDPSTAEKVAARLGWTDLAEKTAALPELDDLARAAADEGVANVALLGMGGSSLATLVVANVLKPARAAIHVLDTTSPVTVSEAVMRLDPADTLYVVASKSGGTIEPNALYAVFREAASSLLGDAAGSRFVAITDPGSSLEALAQKESFRATISSPADVGGRFSAMSVFGLVPAMLAGLDARPLVRRASEAEAACSLPEDENPAVELASFIVDSAEQGADKLTLVLSRADRGAETDLTTFGLWVEQLIAESLGKQGRGVVPVVEYARSPHAYGSDRALVVVRMSGDERLAEWAASRRGIHPVHEIVLDDPYDIAEQFVVWEHAVAFCGILLGVNPFDEPNVAEAKAATASVLDGSAEAPAPQSSVNGVQLTFAGGLAVPAHSERSAATAAGHALASLTKDDYLAVLAYLPDDAQLLRPLIEACASVSAKTGAATCFELGPRYLHSTGQLHKGGPHSGVFVMVTTRDERDVPVPGKPWGLKALHVAQAEGDLTALAAHGRRVLRLDLPDASPASVAAAAEALLSGAGATA